MAEESEVLGIIASIQFRTKRLKSALDRLFKPITEAERGHLDGLRYMGTDPSEDSLNRNWSAAHEDRDYGDPEYAKAYIEVLRPYWSALHVPKTSSGMSWTPGEDELLRRAFKLMVANMPGRSEAAVYARLARMKGINPRWPNVD